MKGRRILPGMVPRTTRTPSSYPRTGLHGLRRSGAVSELLFLYECATRPVQRLRDVARSMDVTVQAASHLYRGLHRRGLAESRQGSYRPTVEGVGWLHSQLEALEAEMGERLGQLKIVRSTRAIAGRRLSPGAVVRLLMDDGLLTALPGADNGSRGTVPLGGAAGEIVEVHGLSGIVHIPPGEITIFTVPTEGPIQRLEEAARRALVRSPHRWIGVQGLEAVWLLRRVTEDPLVRYGLAAAVLDSSQLGVPAVVFVSEPELPRLLAPFTGPTTTPLVVRRLEDPSWGSSDRPRGPQRRSKRPDRPTGRHPPESAAKPLPERGVPGATVPQRPP